MEVCRSEALRVGSGDVIYIPLNTIHQHQRGTPDAPVADSAINWI
jgi:mannose-6-phosphate isomerase-like protein (cupin superfamily)